MVSCWGFWATNHPLAPSASRMITDTINLLLGKYCSTSAEKTLLPCNYSIFPRAYTHKLPVYNHRGIKAWYYLGICARQGPNYCFLLLFLALFMLFSLFPCSHKLLEHASFPDPSLWALLVKTSGASSAI